MYHAIFDREEIDLNGTWRYRLDQNDTGRRNSWYLEENGERGWRDISVPGNWYLNEEIGDYFGVIWYMTKFSVPKLEPGKRLFLRFEGVDYIAEVWINGVYLGLHEGMFDPFEFEITKHIDTVGENILIVRDFAGKDPTEYIEADNDETPLSAPYKFHQSKGITQIKGHMIEAMHRNGCFSSFRQDGNSGGIWGNVSLVVRPGTFIESAKVYTTIGRGEGGQDYDGNAICTVEVHIDHDGADGEEAELNLEIAPYNFRQNPQDPVGRRVTLRRGDNTFRIISAVRDAKLWWTWDHGSPNLYTMRLSVCEDAVTERFGIKEIRKDEKGQWYLNNRRIFLRGMRYISSLWMSEANEEMWKNDFDKMIDMDINSIRIGSHVERDGVYRICDEKGLLLWQVFALHYCVSDSDDVINRASDMIRAMGQMLTNHACLGMWSVYKEPEIYGLMDKPNTYFKLCQVLKDTLGQVDPVRWIHTGDYREDVQNIMIGSCQDGDMDVHTAEIKPHIVEFGADSVPNLVSLLKYIPKDKLWPIDWDTWQYWGLFYYNQFRRAKSELGTSLEEFIDNTQKYEAVVVKEQIELLRQKKYAPVCDMYLYYWSDACPLMGSGLFDYYREPYRVYESMKSVYTQVLVSLEWNEEPHPIGRPHRYIRGEKFVGKVWVTNDHLHEIKDAKISWCIQRAGEEKPLTGRELKKDLACDSSEILDVICFTIPEEYVGEYEIKMKVTDRDGKVLSENCTVISATAQ